MLQKNRLSTRRYNTAMSRTLMSTASILWQHLCKGSGCTGCHRASWQGLQTASNAWFVCVRDHWYFCSLDAGRLLKQPLPHIVPLKRHVLAPANKHKTSDSATRTCNQLLAHTTQAVSIKGALVTNPMRQQTHQQSREYI